MIQKNKRIIAAEKLNGILHHGQSIQDISFPHTDDTGWIKEVVYGTCRYYHQLIFILDQFLKKPLNERDYQITLLLLIGIYEMRFLSTPDYATINETINTIKKTGKNKLSGLCNAILRNVQRNSDSLNQKIQQRFDITYSLPTWLARKIQTQYTDNAKAIGEALLMHPPMTLRINQRKTTREKYLEMLAENDIAAFACELSDVGIQLETPISVNKLPNFENGFVSVQDEGAQLAVPKLDIQNGMDVLDACSAPGGKLCHMLESYDINATAIDINDKRCARIQENLERLELKANVIIDDLKIWKPTQRFDRILLDAPCSATGVIRRHPDIKLLRRESDIKKLTETQRTLLEKCLSLLKPSGKLLYVTCSILEEENQTLIAKFSKTMDCFAPAALAMTEASSQNPQDPNNPNEQPLLPTTNQHDGFYYCLLEHRSTK